MLFFRDVKTIYLSRKSIRKKLRDVVFLKYLQTYAYVTVKFKNFFVINFNIVLISHRILYHDLGKYHDLFSRLVHSYKIYIFTMIL